MELLGILGLFWKRGVGLGVWKAYFAMYLSISLQKFMRFSKVSMEVSSTNIQSLISSSLIFSRKARVLVS